MGYAFLAFVGFVGGAICVFVALDQKRRSLAKQRDDQSAEAERLLAAQRALVAHRKAFEQDLQTERAADAERLLAAQRALFVNRQTLDQDVANFVAAQAAFNSKAVSYQELASENSVLKTDLRNMHLQTQKQKLDVEQQNQRHEQIDRKVNELGVRYLKENVKWIGSALNPNNYANCKQRLESIIEHCRDIGLEISTTDVTDLLGNLKTEYERVVRVAFEREEQSRIRAQIREEQLREKEIDRELKQLQREREAIQRALEKALEQAHGEHSEEIDRLTVRLAEAEAKSQRAVSQAQLTKSGNVYVISNIGSFGEDVFKVGLTRRLEPLDRIRELGDASVPFPFDVHLMIASDDAPSLESELQRALHKCRVNKTNPRKEFFRTTIEHIIQIVKEHHGDVQYVADPEALQYRQSVAMTDDEQEFIEQVFEEVGGEEDATDE